MRLKDIYAELVSKETWCRVAELWVHDPDKRKKGVKLTSMPKEYHLPCVITVVLTLMPIVVSFLAVNCIYPTR
jgi:hypothetical protein